MQIITSLVKQTITIIFSDGKTRTLSLDEAKMYRDLLGDSNPELVKRLNEEIIRLEHAIL